MQTNIIEYIERTAVEFKDKTAIEDNGEGITFSQLLNSSKAIASALLGKVEPKDSIVICMEKGIEFVAAMLACAQISAVYIPLDASTPSLRRQYIVNAVSAKLILLKRNSSLAIKDICEPVEVLYIDDLLTEEICEDALIERRKRSNATDPLYMIFTSGSTGKPKGIVTTHLALISFIDEMAETFAFSSDDSIANQVPFYFDASTKDIFLMCKCGCTMHIIPKKMFMLPKDLMEFLNDKQISRIIWAPSLLCMVANFKAYEKVCPRYLRTVFFVGEQMPTKQMNMWRTHLPDVQYVNLYGSTEVSGSSTYYIIDREMDDNEIIPIGIPFNHLKVFLLDENDRLVDKEDVTGEICVGGLSLTLGYYRDLEKTRRVFQQNPLNSDYREIIYRSGDIGKYNNHNELVYVCRRDYQIKRMGQRIELGEVEAVISSLDGIQRCCCLYNEKTQALLAVYEGTVDAKTISSQLRAIIPAYMLPSDYRKMETIPLNANGKIDRKALKAISFQEGI